MIKFYTPKEWSSIFGGAPSLIIKDDGLIYTADEYSKIMGGTPCGKIDYTRGEIYGADYAGFSASPIAYLKKKDGVTEIYNRDAWPFGSPFLYIKSGKVYTSEEYFRILGGNPFGYFDEDDPEDDPEDSPEDSPEDEPGDNTPGGGAGGVNLGPGCGWAMYAVILIFFIWIKRPDAAAFFAVGGVLFMWGITQKSKGRPFFSQTSGNQSSGASKKANSPKQETPKKETPKKPDPPKKPDRIEAVALGCKDGMNVFQCPVCQSKLSGPVGKGNIILTCPTCQSKLSAKT